MSRCIVPNWNLSPRRQEQVEPEEGNRSSHVHSLQNHLRLHSPSVSLSPHLVPVSEYESAEQTWENGQLAMIGLPPSATARRAWCQASDTLESIVRQATLQKQTPTPNLLAQAQVHVSLAAAGHKRAQSSTGDVIDPPVAGKRQRSDSDQSGRNNICCSSSMQDLNTSASAIATLCKENDTTLMTRASFESPQSFKAKSVEDDLAWINRSENQEEELDTNCKTGLSNSTRRNRTATVHNQSERKRRDKINQKMKALQKLIPNACKTDKASMLDEVIQYLKQLQAQLQLISMRNIPQMIMPLGIQPQLQMSMMAGIGTGLGLDTSNMARATPQQLLRFVHPSAPMFVPPPLPLFMHPMVQSQAKLQPGANDSIPFPDPFRAYLAQTMNMNVYNKTSGLYRQQAKPNTLAGSSPSQSNNVQRT